MSQPCHCWLWATYLVEKKEISMFWVKPSDCYSRKDVMGGGGPTVLLWACLSWDPWSIHPPQLISWRSAQRGGFVQVNKMREKSGLRKKCAKGRGLGPLALFHSCLTVPALDHPQGRINMGFKDCWYSLFFLPFLSLFLSSLALPGPHMAVISYPMLHTEVWCGSGEIV